MGWDYEVVDIAGHGLNIDIGFPLKMRYQLLWFFLIPQLKNYEL
jgi:hypothetical protein